jgi:hypothetical protein
MASTSYKVKISVLYPYRCYKCRWLGHTSQRCGFNNNHCNKCGKPHPDNLECTKRCVNYCGSHTHESDCKEYPAYLEMKKLLKMAELDGITVGEARTSIINLNNAPSRRLVPLLRPDPQPSRELSLLKEKLQAIQSELEVLRESTVKIHIIPVSNKERDVLTSPFLCKWSQDKE